MKCKYIICGVLILLFASCKKDEMGLYSSGHYIQFVEPVTDTINFSFFFYPGMSEVSYPMAVKLVGNMPQKGLNYQIKVDEKVTTVAAKNYTLAPGLQFKQGPATDSAYIILHNSPELAQQTYTLALEIVTAGDVVAGQSSHVRKIIRINDMVSKPDWWNDRMESFYLGEYSERKFRKFIEVTGIGDLGKYSAALQREYILQFKYYLIEMKDAGTPVLEEDGTDMLSTIRITG